MQATAILAGGQISSATNSVNVLLDDVTRWLSGGNFSCPLRFPKSIVDTLIVPIANAVPWRSTAIVDDIAGVATKRFIVDDIIGIDVKSMSKKAMKYVRDCFTSFGQRAISETHADSTIGRISAVLGLDWVTLRLAFPLYVSQFDEEGIFTAGDFRLQFLGYGTKHFKGVANVHYLGSHVARLAFEGNKDTHKGMAMLTFQNEVLYTGLRLGFVTDLLCKAVGGVYQGVSRLDIAVDGLDLRPALAGWCSNDLDLMGWATLRPSNFNRATGLHEQASVGSFRSARAFSFYNKTKELGNSGKLYISNSWHKSGLDTSSDVYRSELRLMTPYFSKYATDFSLTDLDDIKVLAGLFYQAVTQNRWLDFVISPDTKNKSRDAESLNLWSFLKSVSERVFVPIAERVPDAFRTLKIICKRLLKDAFFQHDTQIGRDYLITVGAMLISNSTLYKWFRTRSPFMLKDWHRYVRQTGLAPAPDFATIDSDGLDSLIHYTWLNRGHND